MDHEASGEISVSQSGLADVLRDANAWKKAAILAHDGLWDVIDQQAEVHPIVADQLRGVLNAMRHAIGLGPVL